MSLTVLRKDGSILGQTISPMFPPTQQQQRDQNTQKNNQQWGQGNWAYSQSPSPSGGSKSPDMSAWGKAQPIQPASQGTPYSGDMAAWSSPQTARAALGQEPVHFGRGMWGAPGGEPVPPAGGSKSPDMFWSGKAQPIQPASQGTPYGQAASQSQPLFSNLLAKDAPWWAGERGDLPHAPNDNRPAYDANNRPTGANATNFQNSGGPPTSGFGAPKPMSKDFGAFSPPTFTYGEQQSPMGNWGNSQYGRPQGFQASYFDMQGNPVSAEQQQAQRAAMVLQLHQAQLPYVLGNAMNQNLGKPQFDFNTMLQSANEAVKNGFYNPFQRFYEEQDAIQRLGQQAPPSMHQAPTDPTDWSLPYNDTPVLRRPADYGNDWSRPDTAPTPGWRYGGDMTAPQQPILTQKPVGEDNSGLTPWQLEMRRGTKDYIELPPRTQKTQGASDPVPPWMRPGTAQPVAPPSTGTPYGSPPVLLAPEPAKKRARPQAPAQQPTYNPAQDEVNVYARYAEESSRRAQKELRDMQERFRDLPGKAAQLEFERRQNAKPWPRDKFGRLIRM